MLQRQKNILIDFQTEPCPKSCREKLAGLHMNMEEIHKLIAVDFAVIDRGNNGWFSLYEHFW